METKAQSAARMMRVMKYAFVVAALLIAYVAFAIPGRPGPPANQPLQMAIAIVAISSLVAGFFLPQMISQVAQSSSTTTDLQRWFTKGVLSLACFDACILFGLVLHFLHGSVRLVGFLFAAGIVAELIWNPGEPPGTEDEQSARR